MAGTDQPCPGRAYRPRRDRIRLRLEVLIGGNLSFLQIYGIALLVIFFLMTLLCLISLLLRNSSIVDIFWGSGFVVTAWLYFALTPEGYLLRKWLLVALVTIWGLRLSLHILWRNWGKPEDFRYQTLRREYGGSWWWQSFFCVFMLQGLLPWSISVPLLAAPGHRSAG